MPPKISKAREAKAFKAMKDMGFNQRVVKPVLHKLLKLYGYNWSHIEDGNYHLLLDTICEREEVKKGSMKEEACVGDNDPEDSEPLSKRLHIIQKKKQATSEAENSNHPLSRSCSRYPKEHASSKPEASKSPPKRLRSKQKEEVSDESERQVKKSHSLNYASKSSPLSHQNIQEDSSESEEVPLIRRSCLRHHKEQAMGKEPDEIELTGAHWKGTIVESSQLSYRNQPNQFEPLLPLPHISDKGTAVDSPQNSLKRKRKMSSNPHHGVRIAEINSFSPQVSPIETMSKFEGESHNVCSNELVVELGKVHPIETMLFEGSEAPIMPRSEPFTNMSQHEVSLVSCCEAVPIDMCGGDIKIENYHETEANGSEISEPKYLDWEEKGYCVSSSSQLEIFSTPKGEVKLGLIYDSSHLSDFHIPKLDDVVKLMEEKFLTSYGITEPSFSVMNFFEDFCQCFVRLGIAPTDGNHLMPIEKTNPAALEGTSRIDTFGGTAESNFCIPPGFRNGVNFQNKLIVIEIPGPISVNKLEMLQCIAGIDRKFIEDIQGDGNKKIEVLRSLDSYVCDITRGKEAEKISLVNEISTQLPPAFFYITENRIYQNACVNFALANISYEDCCSQCYGDCVASTIPCVCTRQSGTGFAYKPGGLVKDTYLDKKFFMYKGLLLRKFIKECWCKCGCSKDCGNRVVQQGITKKLQVFMTPEGKGWGLRTLQDLPKGAFVCEFVGEIVTSMELEERNRERSGMHTYTVILDAGRTSKGDGKNKETLCLDATSYGNVARFINHRCSDANLAAIPVEVETPDHCYYHLAFFATRDIDAMEELSWDYGIDFNDGNHGKAFVCHCGSESCRGSKLSKGTKCNSDFQDKEFLNGVFIQKIFPKKE